MTLTLNRPWLCFDLGEEMQVLSWAPHRGGLVRAGRILWREVRNADLSPGLDAVKWLSDELAARGDSDAVCFMTSRDLGPYESCHAEVGGARVDAVATVGLSNAEHVGRRRDFTGMNWGTVNLALRVSPGLAVPALIEVLSIATEARTTALLEAGITLPTGLATGTGTDCIAVAAPEGTTLYAGLHTDLGEAVGRAVYQVISTGAGVWKGENHPL